MQNPEIRNLIKVPELTLIFWIIKIFATTLGETGGDAVVGDFLDKPLAKGGLNLSGYSASLVLFAVIVIGIFLIPQRSAKTTH